MLTKHSITNAAFVLPALGGTVAVPVSNTSWMEVGMFVHVRGGGNFVITSKSPQSVVMLFTAATSNVGPGIVVKVGSSITEGAKEAVTPATDPTMSVGTPIFNGGTGAFSADEARTNLGIKSIQTGTGTLVAGTATVATATITTDSKVFVMRTSDGGGSTLRNVRGWKVSSKTVGAPGSFTVLSAREDGTADPDDVSGFDWMVVG